MEELKLTGNHLKGSRPILTFSNNFDKDAHWKLLKEMIIQVFGSIASFL
jgi:ribosome biogenesis protein BRX1